jgi:hypothetical protein
LAKLYCGTRLCIDLLKSDDTVELREDGANVTYTHAQPASLIAMVPVYEAWVTEQGFDLNRVKLVAGLAYLNIAPLHTDRWSRVLFYKGLELLHESIA